MSASSPETLLLELLNRNRDHSLDLQYLIEWNTALRAESDEIDDTREAIADQLRELDERATRLEVDRKRFTDSVAAIGHRPARRVNTSSAHLKIVS